MRSGKALDELLNPAIWLSRLKRNHDVQKGYAPHKFVLLLAVLDEIEACHVIDGYVAIDASLKASFKERWQSLVSTQSWKPTIAYPIVHLEQDGVWHLVKDGTPADFTGTSRVKTLPELLRRTDGCILHSVIWTLVQIDSYRQSMRNYLTSECGGDNSEVKKPQGFDAFEQLMNLLIVEPAFNDDNS